MGSSDPAALSQGCTSLVGWARTNGVKVQVGEIAIDAEDNKTPPFAGTLATARAQRADWRQFCLANDDVLVRWNWWGNSAKGWWNAGDSQNGSHWGLTLDDGASQTVYVDLIEASVRAPRLVLLDNTADPGTGPNTTISVGWESPDVWVRQNPDGVPVGEPILGGQPAVVYVRVTNRGAGPYPNTGTDVVQLYWAKAQAGLSWPKPWDGSVPAQGGPVAPPQAVGATAAGPSTLLSFAWPSTPNPANYPGNDGHFCLLAVVTKAAAAPFDGFRGPDLNQNVLTFSHVAWRNIHILPLAMRRLGELVVANHTERDLVAQVPFERLDARGQPADPLAGRLTLSPREAALERLRDLDDLRGSLEDLGDGTYRVPDPATGIGPIGVRPGEELPFGVEWTAEKDDSPGYVVRAVQYALEGAQPVLIGGQTFVVGEVEGWTTARD